VFIVPRFSKEIIVPTSHKIIDINKRQLPIRKENGIKIKGWFNSKKYGLNKI